MQDCRCAVSVDAKWGLCLLFLTFCPSVVIISSFVLRFIMARENARRDRLAADTVDHEETKSQSINNDTESSEDLTDWEQEDFRYVL